EHASHRRVEAGGAVLRFVAPDALLDDPGLDADLLLVDEAAAIPVPLLTTLLARFARIVFATTVHGYEGTGRGFAVRFRQVLDRETPGWRELALTDPVRWAAGDPAEAWVGRALALDAEPAPAAALAGLDPATLVIRRLDRDRLADDDALLDQLFGLLVLAHYRTRPYDLKHLLDGPNVSVWVARSGGHVVACALTAREGGLAPAMAEAVFRGERRPRGHLIPQSLAAHLGLPEGAALTGERVLRIAVHPAVQGCGIGSRLIEALLAAARDAGLDWFGTSFGATSGLLRFWSRAGLHPLRLGISREAASGSHSLMMLAALSPAGQALLARARRHFARLLPRLLAGPLQHLDPRLAAALLAAAGTAADAGPMADDRRLLAAVAHADFGLDDALGVLHPFTRQALADPARAARLAPPERDALVARVIEQRDWAEIARGLGLAGRREAIALLRRAVGQLLDDAPGPD
ncbi:MAG TPA: tRNA(Met) cytidine acetyltransferase, partial [Thioalkalivibrio sp.]|nr:tRNA(Met) cytidine acetyltransferase [Thioalkalivibrio sp.]